MSETEDKIVQAAIRCFVRFGARKTSMADIASGAGVSRQTLYDLFDGKDALIQASIMQITEQSLATIANRASNASGFEAKLRIFLEETTVKSFELLQTAGDPEELISGSNQAGADAILWSHTAYKSAIMDFISHEIDAGEIDFADIAKIANYFVTVAMGFKSARDRKDLEELLNLHIRATLALVAGRSAEHQDF